MRVLALDHGEARCGCALSDPSGTLATPLAVVERPDTRRGLDELAKVVREREAELVIVGLPLTLAGERGAQARRAEDFARRLGERIPVPVELHDERLTTKLAERAEDARAALDSRAAAHLLESWLASRRKSSGQTAER